MINRKLVVFVSFCILSISSFAQTRLDSIRNKLFAPENKNVLVASHRGDWRNACENSIEAIDNAVLTVTDKQAELFKNHNREKTLNQGIIYSVLLQKKEAETKVTLSAKKVRSYFPPAYTKEQVEEVIYTLLEQWRKKKGKEEQEDAGDTVLLFSWNGSGTVYLLPDSENFIYRRMLQNYFLRSKGFIRSVAGPYEPEY